MRTPQGFIKDPAPGRLDRRVLAGMPRGEGLGAERPHLPGRDPLDVDALLEVMASLLC